MHDDPFAEEAVTDQPVGSLVGGSVSHREEANRDPLPELEPTIAALERWGRDRGWLGSDPYEGLNARRAPLVRRHPLGRRALIQLVKRSPVDLRRALAIEPRHNAAALGHVLSGYSRLELSEGDRRRRLEGVVGLLERLRSPGFEEPCWGYPFDVESRVFFYPATTPNTIATAFAGLGLLDAHAASGDDRLLELAAGAGDFFCNRVGANAAGAGAFFGYFPGDRTPIHNASLLASGFLARLAESTGRSVFAEAARGGVRYAAERQRSDGSWPYGEVAGLDWVDGFHTGYVLDSLLRCSESIGDAEAARAWERGMRFYRERFILADGTPKYFADRVHPIDSQSVAQAIFSLALGSHRDRSLLDDARRVFDFARRSMRRRDGAFIFQRRRFWRNSTPHVRWAQAPMFDALTMLWTALR